jgi:hypothetical protein
MKESEENNELNKQSTKAWIKKDHQTGLPVLAGPKFTKEEVAKDFPVDCCRDAVILRRSVGLDRSAPFEEEKLSNLHFNNKEAVAQNFPRDCCRFARMLRRSVGLRKDDGTDDTNKCCFAV